MRQLALDYYEGLRRGELLIQTCAECGKDSMYPRERCPFCHAAALAWKRSSGRGQLYSFTVQRAGAPIGFEDELPYALGVIRLDEGVQVLARLRPDAEGTWGDYRVDAEVELCDALVTRDDRAPAPWFRLTAQL